MSLPESRANVRYGVDGWPLGLEHEPHLFQGRASLFDTLPELDIRVG